MAFLSNDQSRQPRVLIPVITAWGLVPGKEAEVKAWALYLQLKTFLGPNMTMDDYDQISIGLLTAGRLDTAVAIFKDMMVTGQDPAKDSTAVYQAALGLAGNLHASSISEQAVNKVSLSALTMLPRQFQNRFFYASWMKKLIGMGQVDSAALVIELMYERNVRPDTKHLNGLVAGWLHEGSPQARDKAERLAWSMIQHRIDAVWKRFQPLETTPRLQVKHQDVESSRIPHFMKREVPPASIETFSILLLHYTRRGDDDMVKYLVKCLWRRPHPTKLILHEPPPLRRTPQTRHPLSLDEIPKDVCLCPARSGDLRLSLGLCKTAIRPRSHLVRCRVPISSSTVRQYDAVVFTAHPTSPQS